MKIRSFFIGLLCAAALFLSGCSGTSKPEGRQVRVVLEEGVGFCADTRVWNIPAGDALTFSVSPLKGYSVTGCDYPGALWEQSPDGSVSISLGTVYYSTVVTVTARQNPYLIRYHDGEKCIEISYPSSHLRPNTRVPESLDGFISPDKTRLLCGYNTKADFSGETIGVGSRVDVEPNIPLDLYAQWVPFTDEGCFDWEPNATGGAVITGYRGQASTIAIPANLGGLPTVEIKASAFEAVKCDHVILPPTLRRADPRAFEGCSLKVLTLFDTIQSITDYAFLGCEGLSEIRINAAVSPVFSGTYFDTFTDKLDRLRRMKDEKKIILFSGSSTRFGYDCEMIDRAFPDYGVVNMGVFAYTNALPQFDLILRYTRPGDVLIHSPEFDAVKRQFAVTNAMDAAFFSMIESDYDVLRLLDYRDYGGLLTAFNTCQVNRNGLEPGSYALSASEFDEDHRRVPSPSYNEYGDYILYRPNAGEDAPVYNLPVDYLPGAFPKETVIAPLNRVYRRFQAKGVRVFFTYAPRNRLALSKRSTPQARKQLDRWLRENLVAPVISDIEESLYPGHLLYGTDNHLSTDGVALRTARVILDVQKRL